MKNWFVLYAVAVVIGATYMDWKAGFHAIGHVPNRINIVDVCLGIVIDWNK